MEMVGPDRLLNRLTKRVLNTALEEETAEYLGYDKHDPVGRNRGNSLNGARGQDGADRDRPGADRGALGHRQELHPENCQETPTRLTGVVEIAA